jgi:hypothetical protein
MKVALDLPRPLLQKARKLAAVRGESLNDFVVQALVAHTGDGNIAQRETTPPAWMKFCGGLAHISDEVRRMQNEIDATFGQIQAEDWK